MKKLFRRKELDLICGSGTATQGTDGQYKHLLLLIGWVCAVWLDL